MLLPAAVAVTLLQWVRFDLVTPAGFEKAAGKVTVILAPVTALPDP
jgi:hypothetical protein